MIIIWIAAWLISAWFLWCVLIGIASAIGDARTDRHARRP